MKNWENGGYVEICETDDALRIRLNDRGKEHIIEQRELGNDVDFFDLFEDFLCNGWDTLRPDEIGALTGCRLIVSPDTERDDHGKLVAADVIYFYEQYAINDPVDRLLVGELRLDKVTNK